MKRVCLFITLICMMMVSCKPEPEKPEGPDVITSGVTDITITSAVCGGGVSDGGGAVIVERGVCWNTSGNPTVLDFSTKDGSGLGSYTSKMTGLERGTTYYVRAYAVNANGVAGYGEEVSFTTLEGTFENVDLGLSVKWATCNVGATSPEDYGHYFAWGETSPKSYYSSSNCPTYGLSYTELQSQGYIDSEGKLTPQYDAATANWGGDWRMPTKEEMRELLNNCTWIWTTQNGVNGYNVKGPNGNSIFLPAAGYRNGSSLDYAGSLGHFWSSAPRGYDYDFDAYYLHFNGDEQYMVSYYRDYGRSVRPVVE